MCPGKGRGDPREEVEIAAGPMALREEEEGLSHIVGAVAPRKKGAAIPGRRRGSPLFRMSPGRRRGTSDLSEKHTQRGCFWIKVRRRQGGGEAPPLLL